MPEVIADTSALQYLCQTGHLDLLHHLYRTILVPEGVHEEFEEGRRLGELTRSHPLSLGSTSLPSGSDSTTLDAVLELAGEVHPELRVAPPPSRSGAH